MIIPSFIFATLVVAATSAQVRPIETRGGAEWKSGRPPAPPNTPKSTVIENKNVNIIVNVDPKDVAKELYNLIQGRLEARPNRRSFGADEKQTIHELEKIITPIVKPTRRTSRPTAFEVAYALDHVTRRALTSDHPTHPTIDDEIVTRNVVARMMTKLKSLTETDKTEKEKEGHDSPAFRMMSSSEDESGDDNGSKSNAEDDDEDDDDDDYNHRYITFKLSIRKTDLLKLSGKTLEE